MSETVQYSAKKSAFKGLVVGGITVLSIAIPTLAAWVSEPGNAEGVLPPKYVWLAPALVALGRSYLDFKKHGNK